MGPGFCGPRFCGPQICSAQISWAPGIRFGLGFWNENFWNEIWTNFENFDKKILFSKFKFSVENKICVESKIW